MNNGILSFWTELFLKPKLFFKKHVRNSRKEPKYFTLAIIVFCIGWGTDRLDSQLMKMDARGDYELLNVLNNWFLYWIIAIVAGFIGGYIVYLIGGWFYDVRVVWSKGKSDLNKSRYIYLFSGVIINSAIVLLTIISTGLNAKPYLSEFENPTWSIFSSLVILFFIFYSIYISYTGVRSVTNVDKTRSIIWFIVLPVIVYVFVYIALFALIFQQY